MGGAEGLGPVQLSLVQVHGHDGRCPGYPGALDRSDADPTGTDHQHGRAWGDLGRVEGGTDTGRDAAADECGDVQWDVLVDLHGSHAGNDGLLGERATAGHGADDRVAPPELRVGAHGDEPVYAEVGLVAAGAERAGAARRGEGDDHVVAGHHMGHAVADVGDDPCALVSQDGGRCLGDRAVHGRQVGVADAAVGDLHLHVTGSHVPEGHVVGYHQLLGRAFHEDRCEHRGSPSSSGIGLDATVGQRTGRRWRR